MTGAESLGTVEREVAQSSSLIASVRALGADRPYVAALIGLDRRAAEAFAVERELPGDRPLAEEDSLRAAIADAIALANRRLATADRVRRFTILPVGDQPREPVEQHHGDAIEAMYL